MPFISVPSLNFTTNVRNVTSNEQPYQPADDGWWQNAGWSVSESSWSKSPDSVVDNGSFEEDIDGWDDNSEENFTDENGKEHVFDATWNPDTQRMKHEITPNNFQFQSIASKLIQYPFDSDVWYKFKSTINFLPEDITPFTKFILSIWKDGDVPDINNTFVEQSFDVDQLTNGQEISLDFMPTDENGDVLEALQVGFRLSDDSTDSNQNVVIEVDNVEVTDSQDDELERTYTLSLETDNYNGLTNSYEPVPIGDNELPSVVEGYRDNAGHTLYVVLETDGLIEDTKVPFYVESPEGEGSWYSPVHLDKMTDRDELGHVYFPNVFTLTEDTTTTSIMKSSRVGIWVLPNVVCVRPQTIAIWIPHSDPELSGRENALAEIEFEVTPNIEIYDKSDCEPVYSSLSDNNDSPEEGDSMGINLHGQRMTHGVVLEGDEYPIGTWEITSSSIGISSPTSGTFIIDNDDEVPVTTVQTIDDGVYKGSGGGFTMSVHIGDENENPYIPEITLTISRGFADAQDPPEDPPEDDED